MSRALDNIAKLAALAFVTEPRFGAKGDGIADDLAAMQLAIDTIAAAGGGVVIIPPPPGGAYYRITRALQMRDGVTLWVTSPDTRVVSDSSAAGSVWPYYGALMFSSIGSNLSSYSSFAAADVAQGDVSVALSSAGDGTNFQQGDVVLVATSTTWGAAGIPAWGQVNVVKSVSGGTLSLRHGIDATKTGVVVYRLSRTSVTGGGYTLHGVRDAAVIGGTWEATLNGALNAPAIVFGGMIDCKVDVHRVSGWGGFPYGNLIFNCDIKARHVETYGRGIELAFLSSYNCVDVGTMLISRNDLDGSGNPPNGVVWCNEGANANDVRVRHLNAGAVTAPNLVRASDTSRNTIEIGAAVANSHQSRGVQFEPSGTSGAPGCYDNEVSIRWARMPAAAFFVTTGGTLEARNTLRNSTFLGVASSNAAYLNGGTDTTIADVYFEDGSVQIGASTNYTIRNVRCADKIPVSSANVKAYAANGSWASVFDGARSGSLRLIEPEYTVNGVGATTKTLAVPAGAMTHGCAIDYEIVVVTTGSGGTKTVDIKAGGTTLVTHTIATGTVTSKITGRLLPVQSLAALWFEARRLFGASEETSVGSVTVALGSAWNLEFVATVPTSGDTCQVRVLRAKVSTALDAAA